MTGTPERNITDEMIEAAARAYAKLEGNDYDAVSKGNRLAFYGAAGAILEAALAGCTVVELPEPTNTGRWQISEPKTPDTSVEAGTVAVLLSVQGYYSSLTPERAGEIGAALIAARLAAESREGSDPRPSIHSIETAMTQPHAMVNDDGDVFYPDGPEDAAYFAEHHGARPLREGSDHA